MPWFAVDDGFDNHPKIRKAGNAAAGLFCRLGAYAARHTTEGHVPGPVARDYGTPAQFRKLAGLGMLHVRGHECPRCEQPEAGDWVIHDYLLYNRSKDEVEQAREAGAERQRRRRARLAEERASIKTATPTGVPTETSGETPDVTPTETSGETPDCDNIRRSEPTVTPDFAEERARLAPPLPSLPPTEVGNASKLAPPARGVPDVVRPLQEALAAHPELAGTAWNVRRASDWERIRRTMVRVGVRAMVAHALAAARMRSAPAHVTAWLPGWESLANEQPAAEQGAFLLAIPGGGAGAARPSTTDQRVGQALALAAQLRAQEAQEAQEAGTA
ncbi:hypothetical protein [Streptacidiphilus albus]|uniref:hypothetical protein n=1 Tax=Streptacidiphilus albus TaxID=105425 RepID=UPI000691623E|nr:hypothetical protein [Streptacidiphilus albus]